MGLSAYSSDSLEDVIAQAEGKTNPYAMQISLLKNHGLTIRLLNRAESRSCPSCDDWTKWNLAFNEYFSVADPVSQEAGYKAILLTVDAPMLGRRLNKFRNSFNMPKSMTYPNIAPGVDMTNLEGGDNSLAYGRSL